MCLRRVLNAGMESRTGRIRPQVQEFEILFVLLTKSDSRRAPPDRVDVELNRSIAERDIFECRIAAVQSHQAAIKTELLQELRILFHLPLISRHRDVDRLRALRNLK